jgi:hypothetical protein
MTNTIFSTFQTQYILDFSSASRRGTLGFAKTLRFSRPKMLLQVAPTLHILSLHTYRASLFYNARVRVVDMKLHTIIQYQT